MRGRSKVRQSGFTIIEVLIVLAIAGLILVIVLLATPALRRSVRNNHRKAFVDLVSGELDTYASQHSGILPSDNASMCDFINQYLLQSAGGGSGSCTFVGGSSQCILVQAPVFNICFHDRDSTAHSYPVTANNKYDEISIMLAHYCNTSFNNSIPANNGSNPHVISATADDFRDVRHFVVWTPLENANYYCLDNH
jgi:prepilin-type N-terminal cleavage/methylation domain-containing protein